MPNIKSAKKRVRLTAANSLRNQAAKSALKTSIKKCEAAITANTEAETAFRAAVKSIDRSVQKGVLDRNTGARKKSKLAKKLNALSAG